MLWSPLPISAYQIGWRHFAVVAGLFTLAACAAAPEPELSDATLEIRLIETTDLHAYIHGYDYFANRPTTDYGLAHTAALIAEARAQNPNHLLVDNGDLIQGSSLGDWAARMGTDYLAENGQVHPVIAALNHLQYDVANLGNHEFNFGLEFLEATLAGAQFPYISANVFYADDAGSSGRQTFADTPSIEERRSLVEPYVILSREFVDSEGEAHNINVGFIGFLPPQIMDWDTRHLTGNVAVYDIVETAQYFIPRMKQEGADVIVAVPHSGLQAFDDYPQFAEQATMQLAQVEGIDAILFGHQHSLFPGSERYDDLPDVDNEGGYVFGVPAVQPGYWGSHLGIIDLTLQRDSEGWRVAASEVALPAIDERKDEDVEAVVADAHEATIEWLQQPVLTLQTPLRNYFAQVQPELTVQLINAAQREHGLALQRLGALPQDLPVLSAAAPFRNGGQNPANYTSIDAGVMTLANLSDLYLYPNTIQVVRLNGAQIRDWLEMSARVYRQIEMQQSTPEPLLRGDVPSFNFDIIAGVTYELQPHNPERFNAQGELTNSRNHRVYNLRYQGELIGSADEFLVVTNNYRAGGGGSFPHLDGSTVVYDGAHMVRTIIQDYVGTLDARHSQGYRMSLDHHWHLALPRGAQVYLDSAPTDTAQEEARQLRDIEFMHYTGEGFGRFRILP